jgi:hypothetical protein
VIIESPRLDQDASLYSVVYNSLLARGESVIVCVEGMYKKWLIAASALEVATGLVMAVDPAFVSRLLFAEGIAGSAVALGRVAGLGLFSMGLACWPGHDHGGDRTTAFRALLIYNVSVMIDLICLGIRGRWVGPLLWPSVPLHAVLAFGLAAGWLDERRRRPRTRQT